MSRPHGWQRDLWNRMRFISAEGGRRFDCAVWRNRISMWVRQVWSNTRFPLRSSQPREHCLKPKSKRFFKLSVRFGSLFPSPVASDPPTFPVFCCCWRICDLGVEIQSERQASKFSSWCLLFSYTWFGGLDKHNQICFSNWADIMTWILF